MTEHEWQSSTEPYAMLGHLGRKASKRKRRLFGVACCQRVWHLIADEASRDAVRVAELHVDGLASEKTLSESREKARTVVKREGRRATTAIAAGGYAGGTMTAAMAKEACLHARGIVNQFTSGLPGCDGIWAARAAFWTASSQPGIAVRAAYCAAFATAAARFYADAFAGDPKLALDLRQPHRYNAACSAALAAAGQSEDAKNVPDKARPMLRRQSLAWLRDDLVAAAKRAEQPDTAAQQFVRKQLTHWQQDTDLISVRAQLALDNLPGNERQQWRQLWDDVGALLKKIEEKK
jgi:hypothetical protein